MKLLWTTDTHLNFINYPEEFGKELSNVISDGLIITGDISDSIRLDKNLRAVSESYKKPIYFIVGNHDFYESSFKQMDMKLKSYNGRIHYMPQNIIKFGDVCLVGNSNWYDVRYGNEKSRINLNDFVLIYELRELYSDSNELIACIRKRSHKMSKVLKSDLVAATAISDKILIALHVPPYEEATWHEGKLSDSDWLPYFSSKFTGEVIDEFSEKFPEKKFTVLCGHTHSGGYYKRSNNVEVYTGSSKYGQPYVCGIVDTEKFSIDTITKQFPKKQTFSGRE